MKQTLHFLERLSRHNEREWFNAHKEEYVKAREGFTALTGQVLDGIRRFDDRIGLLDPAACCYRIYRDLRFSKDKTPYKTHMGFYINPGGKKSGYSGYKKRRPDSTMLENKTRYAKVIDLIDEGISRASNIEVDDTCMKVTVYNQHRQVVDSFRIPRKKE